MVAELWEYKALVQSFEFVTITMDVANGIPQVAAAVAAADDQAAGLDPDIDLAPNDAEEATTATPGLRG